MLAILYELKDRKYVIVHILIATIQRSVEDSRISSPNHEPSDFHKLLNASTDVWFLQQNKKNTNKLLRLEVNIVLTVKKKRKQNREIMKNENHRLHHVISSLSYRPIKSDFPRYSNKRLLSPNAVQIAHV